MKFRRVAGAAFLTAYLFTMEQDVAAEPLDPFRWKNRLILASVSSADSRAETAALLTANRAALTERDLKVIDVSPDETPLPGAVRLRPAETAALREKLKLNNGASETVFVLFGKDGGEKARQRGTLKLEKWFGLIDGMPMRREEMRRKAKGTR